MKIKVNCDCCGKNYNITPKQNYDLKEFIIYCTDCAEKLKFNKYQALKQGIKIYKM